MESSPLAINTPTRECSESQQPPRLTSLLQAVVLGVAVLGFVAAVLWLQERPDPIVNGPIELKRGFELLPNSTMKAYGLHLPRAGRLVVSLSSDSGGAFSVYLVGLQGADRPARGNELRLVEHFTAEGVKEYARTAAVEPGEYHLTIVNSAPAETPRKLNLNILVRLDN